MPNQRHRQMRSEDYINEAKDFLKYIQDNVLGCVFSRDELKRTYEEDYRAARRSEENYLSRNRFSHIRRGLRELGKLVELGDQYFVGATSDNIQNTFVENDEDVEEMLRKREEIKKSKPFYCVVCGVDCESQGVYNDHKGGYRHRGHEAYIEIRRRKEQLLKCSSGLQITSSPPANSAGVFEEVSKTQRQFYMTVTVTNCSLDAMLLLDPPDFLWQTEVFEFEIYRRVSLQPGNQHSVKIVCRAPKSYGHTFVPVVFRFRWKEKGKTSEPDFSLRFASVHVVNDLHEELEPFAPFEWPVPLDEEPVEEILKAPALPEGTNPGKGSLPACPIPKRIRNEAARGLTGDNKIVDGNLRAVLDVEVTPQNYKTKFQTLLWVEEIQMEKDILRYDMHKVDLEPDSRTGLIYLEVPGLAERRPSLLRGDRVLIYKADEHNVQYEGRVNRVERDGVLLGVHERLKQIWMRNMKFDVRFDFSRFPLWNEHRAVKAIAQVEPVVFPTVEVLMKLRHSEIALKPWFDRKLNDEQKEAVTNIVYGTSHPAPYLVFGPPGTGKTVTLTEAIRQVFHCDQDAKILVCAPENTAADLLMKKLISSSLSGPVTKRDIFRMYAISRSTDAVPEEIRDACNIDRNGEIYVPSRQDLKRFRVIVVTLMNSGRLVSCAFPTNYFTHIFIDEAGHATEPECIIPIAGLLNMKQKSAKCQIALAGDPKQLGAILRSPFALNFGLEWSFLERLMTKNRLYQRGDVGYNPLMLTKLVRNYRSHDEIISVPRQLFYDGELIAAGDPMILDCMIHWEHLPNRKVPMIFHQVYGTDEREGNSPSFFNRDEVAQVDAYLKMLLTEKKGGQKVRPKDIGIISPYRRQVLKIRQTIEKRDYDVRKEIMVGSVEEFQGQEKLVIIISTVRSINQQYTNYDLLFHLGFLRNPKRFNVAITRARALLIVIGNPLMLEKDENWKTLLTYLQKKNCWKGKRPPVEKISRFRSEIDAVLDDRVKSMSMKENVEEPHWERRD